MKTFFFTILALVISPFFLAPTVFAQNLPCGNIINQNGDLEPIEDCNDPFDVTIEPSSTYSLVIEGREYENGAIVEVEGGETNEISASGTPTQMGYGWDLYRHDGNDYRYIDLSPTGVDDNYIDSYIDIFFADNERRRLYREILQVKAEGGDTFTYYFNEDNTEKMDTVTGKSIYDTLEDFYRAAYSSFEPEMPMAGVGTYTLVVTEFTLIQSNNTIWDKVKEYVVPTAHAQFLENYRYTITFTLKEATPEPQGASSVLFLPGIMGSRLYEDADGCNTTGEGQERWVSLSVCDQLRLMVNSTGNSINDIYTTSDQSSILVSQVYKTFFDNLSEWKEQEIIEDYVAVPYDWRLGLDRLLKAKEDPNTGKIKFDVTSSVQEGYLYKTLEKLANDSYSGKVTIVAHSNGGLLAKAFLATLDRDNDPLADKVDVLIMVASPQLGTPDALVGILHGSKIVPYLLTREVVSQETSRQLLGTMPFAYHLLPSTQYFDGTGVTVNTPVLTFESGSLTTPWANTFGNTVNTSQNMQAFMQTSSGRTVPDVDDLETPAVVSGTQFNYSNSIHLLMNAWVPASTTKVYEIAGTGIKTASGIRYYTGRECGVLNPFCLIFNPKVLYQVKHTIDGDGTVVVPSALGMSTNNLNIERRWLNIDAYNRSGLLNSTENKNHSSIFDVSEVNTFIKDILESSTSSSYQYITDTAPNITNEDRLDFYLHSPLDMSIRLPNGRQVSSSSPETNDGTYRRYGELQYISIPNTSSNKTLILRGIAAGSFTLEIEEYKNGSTTKRQSYSAIPSSTSTQVTVPLTDSSSLPGIVLAVDYDGNGSIDVSYDTTGQVVTYVNLQNAINALPIPSIYKKILLETAKIAEQNYQKSLTKNQFKKVEKLTLNVLKQQIILYGKLKIISVSDQQKIVNIIDNLLNK